MISWPRRQPLASLCTLLLLSAFLVWRGHGRSAAAPAGGLDQHAFLAIVGVPSVPPDTIRIEPHVGPFSTDTITFITNAGDARLFVGEKDGVIRVIDANGALLPTPFLDVVAEARTFNWEEGLLGLAFHPDYLNNGLFFVLYTWDDPSGPFAPDDGQIRLVRYRVAGNPATSNVADPASATLLLRINKPPQSGGEPSPVHNAGDIHFGPDGYLYIATGDGGPDPTQGADPVPGDPFNNSQRRNILLGKILRIDVDNGTPYSPDCGRPLPATPAPYSIPEDNPFRNGPGLPRLCDEIWATGLRNPWRFSFDRLAGDMYIGDVGEWEREEIDFQAAGAPGGANYGWHCFEGTFDWRDSPETQGDCNLGGFVPPIFEYDHSLGFSIIGGFVYRGDRYPALRGQYLFADFFTHRIWRMSRRDGVWETKQLNVQLPGPGNFFWSTFGEDAAGELYLGRFIQNQQVGIYRIVVP